MATKKNETTVNEELPQVGGTATPEATQQEAPQGVAGGSTTGRSSGRFTFAITKDWTPPAGRKKGGASGTQKYHWDEFSEVGMSAPVPDVSPNVIRKSISKFLAKQRDENLKAFLAERGLEGGTVQADEAMAAFTNENGWDFEVYSMGRNEDKSWKGVHVLRNK